MTTVTEKQECRVCGVKFSGKILLNFGEQTIVDFLEQGEVGRGKAPLQLVQCESCGLVQLRHTVDADTLYRKFFYRSSINEQMRDALKDVVEEAMDRVEWQHSDVFCDIGSNDGELLLNYPNTVLKIGFEPAEALAEEAASRFRSRQDASWEVIPSYFNAIEAMAASRRVPFKIITACAMFYDLDNPKEFLYDVKACLDPGGVFVVQMNYLGSMVRNLAFDNIGHEHLCYYSLTTMKKLFDKIGLEIFEVELNEVNGGSIRVYTGHKNVRPIKSSVQDLLMVESTQLSEHSIKNFAERADSIAKVLLSFLKELKKQGKRVYAYGASTRGMTLLQTIFREEKATDYIIAAAERDNRKYGKTMAGMDIPIISEAEAREKADYMLVLCYHFWKSIREREKFWMRTGGKFIIPLPYPKVMYCMGEGPASIPVAHDLTEELESIKV